MKAADKELQNCLYEASGLHEHTKTTQNFLNISIQVIKYDLNIHDSKAR
jgi:hypothetical protein